MWIADTKFLDNDNDWREEGPDPVPEPDFSRWRLVSARDSDFNDNAAFASTLLLNNCPLEISGQGGNEPGWVGSGDHEGAPDPNFITTSAR